MITGDAEPKWFFLHNAGYHHQSVLWWSKQLCFIAVPLNNTLHNSLSQRPADHIWLPTLLCFKGDAPGSMEAVHLLPWLNINSLLILPFWNVQYVSVHLTDTVDHLVLVCRSSLGDVFLLLAGHECMEIIFRHSTYWFSQNQNCCTVPWQFKKTIWDVSRLHNVHPQVSACQNIPHSLLVTISRKSMWLQFSRSSPSDCSLKSSTFSELKLAK